MTFIGCFDFLLFLLLLGQVYGEETELMFRAQGNAIEMGYCFGVDYIVVYRSAPEGDQLLGNSSASITPPADLQDRVRLIHNHNLLGLQISNLTHMDSGIYRRECWQNHTRVSQVVQQVSVCNEEVEAEEIVVKEEAERAELLCKSNSTGLEGISVQWYYEMYPSYKLALFLDSSVSLEPLVKELQGVVEVKERGALLVLDNSLFKNHQQFYCVVIKGKNCLSFQNIYPPHATDEFMSRDIFVSEGDRVVLKCSSDGNNQHWETPLGTINGSSMRNNQMYVSVAGESDDFSLVIYTVTDEHSGDYSCISTSHEQQYHLVLCPKKEPQENYFYVGRNVSLECKVDQDNAQRVQWYRRETSRKDELISDSKDKTVSIPEDLRGRLTLSDNDLMLTISDVEVKDAGLYWCVAFRGPALLEDDNDGDFNYEYGEEDTEDNEIDGDQYWYETSWCIFKQEINVKFYKTRTGPDLEAVSRNSVAYAVGAGLVGVAVVGGIVAVIVSKKKKATSRSGLNTNKDIKMNEDPSCVKGLTNDEHGAEENL